ncbi:MAG: NAD+ synthase [Candidatus Omnitrophica bacterium]|nr:NAD+ synthase [Candidatus Omnitrophota bacterium]
MKTPLKIAIAQMNPTVGDYAGNAAKILRWIDESEAKGADLIVFPEAALCGYPVWDLANKKAFVDAGLKELKRIAAATKGKNVAVVLGFIDRGASPESRVPPNAFNSVAWLEKGKIRTVYHKQLLPTYDVFLEEIFFRPGSETEIVPFRGHKVGLTICEDIWDERYEVKPLAGLAKKKVDLVLNISASPYYRDVAVSREQLLKKHTRRYGFPILYVNQMGGQDDLLFDGRSMFVDAKSRILFRAPAFEEGLYFLGSEPIQPLRLDSVGEIYQALVMGVRDYFRKNGFKKAVIGLSGGIDSALVATIAVDALGKDAVKGVTMPGPFSSVGSWKDSEQLAKNLGIEFEVRPIKKMYEIFLAEQYQRQATRDERPSLAMENLQARLRGMELMFISNDEGRLVLTTGNKSELAMGYCTLYGDMAGGLAVIGDVYKTDVYRLAHYRNTLKAVIPESTLTKAPSAELRPNQKDQDSLPAYDVLDKVLYLYIEKNLSRDEIVRKLTRSVRHREEPCLKAGRRGDLADTRLLRPILGARNDMADLIADITRKVDHNEYKRRQTPPILRVTEKAWFGRRMPITNRFQG